MNNVIVYSNSLEKHRGHIRLVLIKLQELGLYQKLSKCKFEMQ
jgi:hypothetical protein